MAPASKYKFEAVQGIFQQSLPDTDWQTFDYAKNDMGLTAPETWQSGAVTDSSKPWVSLLQHIDRLNAEAPDGVSYKLIINGRHGEGYHNVAQAKYGMPAWRKHYGRLDNLDGHPLSNARLTAVGEEQARMADGVLSRQIQERGLPIPSSFYVSPLHRCLQTAHMEWQPNIPAVRRPFKPVVKELLREVLGVDTCDRRASRTVIASHFPEVLFEDGFAEEDLLWRVDYRENHDEHDIRTQALLEDVFAHDSATLISFTSHAGSISSLLRVLRHRLFPMQTGSLIPLVIKATRLT